MSDCIFCKLANKEIETPVVYEDELVFAFNDHDPKAQTHLLVIPKAHIVNLDDLDADNSEQQKIMAHMMFVIPKIAQQLGLEGYRTITNTGSKGGQMVFHMHFHILAGPQLPGF